MAKKVILGVLMPKPCCIGVSAMPTNYANAVANSITTINPWFVSDCAMTPTGTPYTTSTPQPRRYWAANNGYSSVLQNANSLFACLQIPPAGGTARISFANNGETTYSSLAWVAYNSLDAHNNLFGSGDGVSINIFNDQNPCSRTLVFGHNSTASLVYFSNPDAASSTNNSVRVSEFGNAYAVELPQNQELTSYRRERTAPSMIEIKTLDGAQRKAITGVGATALSFMARWSDGGTTANSIDIMLQVAKDNAWPLILYVPEGIYYNGPFLDLVYPSSDPTITMPAPGVYELTIEGTCQP